MPFVGMSASQPKGDIPDKSLLTRSRRSAVRQRWLRGSEFRYPDRQENLPR
jgi:hypothetical protein